MHWCNLDCWCLVTPITNLSLTGRNLAPFNNCTSAIFVSTQFFWFVDYPTISSLWITCLCPCVHQFSWYFNSLNNNQYNAHHFVDKDTLFCHISCIAIYLIHFAYIIMLFWSLSDSSVQMLLVHHSLLYSQPLYHYQFTSLLFVVQIHCTVTVSDEGSLTSSEYSVLRIQINVQQQCSVYRLMCIN